MEKVVRKRRRKERKKKFTVNKWHVFFASAAFVVVLMGLLALKFRILAM